MEAEDSDCDPARTTSSSVQHWRWISDEEDNVCLVADSRAHEHTTGETEREQASAALRAVMQTQIVLGDPDAILYRLSLPHQVLIARETVVCTGADADWCYFRFQSQVYGRAPILAARRHSWCAQHSPQFVKELFDAHRPREEGDRKDDYSTRCAFAEFRAMKQ